jgi:hypothetical protein
VVPISPSRLGTPSDALYLSSFAENRCMRHRPKQTTTVSPPAAVHCHHRRISPSPTKDSSSSSPYASRPLLHLHRRSPEPHRRQPPVRKLAAGGLQ